MLKRKILLLISVILFVTSCSSQKKHSAESYCAEGMKLIEEKDYITAIEYLKNAIELDSLGNCKTGTDGTAYNELGFAYLRIKDSTNALRYLNKSIKLDSKNKLPRMNKVTLYLTFNEIERGLLELNLFIEELPGYPMAYWQRGNIYEYKGEKDKALLEYRKARAFNRKQNWLPKEVIDDINEKLKNN